MVESIDIKANKKNNLNHQTLNNLDNKQYFLILFNHAKKTHIYLTTIPLNF
jgi:hypothetical protein